MIQYIVIWTEISNYADLFEHGSLIINKPRTEVNDAELHEDRWHVADNFEEAEALYNELIDEGDKIITCSIVVPIKSTDYQEVTINV